MPLEFANPAVRVLFAIFLSCAVLCALGEAVVRIFLARRCSFCAAEGFLGAAIACLAPQYPLVYLALFLLALGEGATLFSKDVSAFPRIAAECLFYAATAQLFPEALPWYAHVLFAVLPLVAAGGAWALNGLKKARVSAFGWALFTVALLNLLFAALLLFKGTNYNKIVLFAGHLLVAAMIFERFPKKRAAGALLALFFFLGTVLLGFGYPLALADTLV